MSRVYGTYSLSSLQRSMTVLSKEVEKMNRSVASNTLEFKKINNKIVKSEAEAKKIEERTKPDWREVPDITDEERFPLVQEAANIPDKVIDLTMKKLDIL